VREDAHVVGSVALVTATAVLAPERTHVLLWLLVAAVLTLVLAGCSLTLMRRRSARNALGTQR
jgi:hypothetical protein